MTEMSYFLKCEIITCGYISNMKSGIEKYKYYERKCN